MNSNINLKLYRKKLNNQYKLVTYYNELLLNNTNNNNNYNTES